MTKLQFTPQMFECCIRETVHIRAQKIFEDWYAKHVEKDSHKLSEVVTALEKMDTYSAREILFIIQGSDYDPTPYCTVCGSMTKTTKICCQSRTAND